MTIIEAIVMGIVQGLTEFLPVSSSGHLAIFRNILNINLEGGVLFEVLLHIGTLVAIIIAYFKDIQKLIIEGVGLVLDFFRYLFNILNPRKKTNISLINSEYRRFVLLIIIASIPTAILGLLLEEIIEGAFTTLLIPGICLLITGCLLYISDKIKKGYKKEKNTKYKDSVIIGLFQGFATMPGISRSGSTIVAGLLCGLDREFAVKFSFLMSLPAIGGATLLQIKDINSNLMNSTLVTSYILGMVASAIVGYICIKTLLKIIKDNKFHYFAYYCWAAGFFAIIGYIVK